MKLSEKMGYNVFLRLMTLFPTMLIRRNRKIMVFGAWFGDKYADNAKYLYEYILREKKEYKVFWFTQNEKVYEELQTYNYPVVMQGTFSSIWLSLRAKYFFYCTDWIKDFGILESRFMGGATFINLWHGIPIKKIMYDDIHNGLSEYANSHKYKLRLLNIPYKNTYICATSTKIREIFVSAFKSDTEHVKIWGQPRFDSLSNGSLSHKSYSNIEHRRTIAYLPTHRKEGAKKMDIESIFDLSIINDFCKKNECLFIIKKHFYHRGEKSVLDDYDYIIDLTNEDEDTQEILYNADILVTDYSSCYIDYLLLERPILFYTYDDEDYKQNDRDVYFEYEKITPGEHVNSTRDLVACLESLIDNPQKNIDRVLETKNIFFDAKVQKNICENIMNEIERLEK